MGPLGWVKHIPDYHWAEKMTNKFPEAEPTEPRWGPVPPKNLIKYLNSKPSDKLGI